MIPVLYGSSTIVYGDDQAVYVGENGEVFSDEVERVDFDTLGIGPLSDAISCNIRTVLNGQFELEMKYPVSGIRYEELKVSSIIKAVAEKNGKPQLFDIYAITKPMNGIVTVYASHVSGRKQFIPVMPCTAGNATSALVAVKENSAENNPFTFSTDKSTQAQFKLTTPVSLGQALGGMRGSILDVYGGEYEFDNFKINLWTKRGHDRGVTLRYGKNITDFEQEESIASTITGICPFWSDSDGNSITLSEKVVESPQAANFPFRRTVVKDFSTYFDEQPTEAQLRAVAQAYVASEGIGIPSVGMTVSFENLSDYEEYENILELEQVSLGDTIRVHFDPYDVVATARVVETIYDTILDKYKSVRIGSIKSNLSQVINGLSYETENMPTGILERASENAKRILEQANGGTIYIKYDGEGKATELYIIDTDSPDTATRMWRWNINGWGYSGDGGETYTTAATMDGTIFATLIKAGILSSDNGNFYVNLDTGRAELKDVGITGGTMVVRASSYNDGRIDIYYDQNNYPSAGASTHYYNRISPAQITIGRDVTYSGGATDHPGVYLNTDQLMFFNTTSAGVPTEKTVYGDGYCEIVGAGGRVVILPGSYIEFRNSSGTKVRRINWTGADL